jgi:hypothetical protein
MKNLINGYNQIRFFVKKLGNIQELYAVAVYVENDKVTVLSEPKLIKTTFVKDAPCLKGEKCAFLEAPKVSEESNLILSPYYEYNRPFKKVLITPDLMARPPTQFV